MPIFICLHAKVQVRPVSSRKAALTSPGGRATLTSHSVISDVPPGDLFYNVYRFNTIPMQIH